MHIHKINGSEELRSFLDKHEIVLLDFGAEWCGPCRSLKKRISEKDIDEIMPKLVFCYLDVDEDDNEDIARSFRVKGLPTQVFITSDMKELGRIEGYNFTELCELYNTIFKDH